MTDTITIIGVGDIMLGTDYPDASYLPPGDDCKILLEQVNPLLRNADITFGNLEGTFAGDKGQAKICRDVKNCFVFRMPERYAQCLVDAGFDMVSLANNHSMDFGPEGMTHTMTVLQEAGVAFAGIPEHPVEIIEKNGTLIGIAAFAPNRGSCDLRDISTAVKTVHDLSSECDVVIVSFHGGAEGEEHQHVTRTRETYLGYDRGNIYEFAHAVVDAGADLVFGHGPHVTRAVELYRDRFIIYSLGNFCTYGRFNLQGPNGFAPMVKIYCDPQGKFLAGKVIPVQQSGRGVTLVDPEGNAIKILQDLTRSDFPEIPVTITDEGWIIPFK